MRIRYYVKHIFLETFGRLYFLYFSKKDTRKCKYFVSICMIFRNEAPFLQEWLNHHIIVGIQHFYLYNNESTDNYREILEPYIKRGIVTLIDWPGRAVQCSAYRHCTNHFFADSNWIGFIDADEFVCPRKHNDIRGWLFHYSRFPGVFIPWLQFGTGAITQHDFSKGVTEQYFICEDRFFSGKCFINTRFPVHYTGTPSDLHKIHQIASVFGKKMIVHIVNINKHFFLGLSAPTRKNASMQINHYYTKAFNLGYAKMRSNIDGYYPEKSRDSLILKLENNGSSSDYSIVKFFFLRKMFEKELLGNDIF